MIPRANGGAPIEVSAVSIFVTTTAAEYLFRLEYHSNQIIANLGEGL